MIRCLKGLSQPQKIGITQRPSVLKTKRKLTKIKCLVRVFGTKFKAAGGFFLDPDAIEMKSHSIGQAGLTWFTGYSAPPGLQPQACPSRKPGRPTPQRENSKLLC